jgi:hypothetical protein
MLETKHSWPTLEIRCFERLRALEQIVRRNKLIRNTTEALFVA